jgi:hypothetical protein
MLWIFELRASCLPGRCSTTATWTIPPPHLLTELIILVIVTKWWFKKKKQTLSILSSYQLVFHYKQELLSMSCLLLLWIVVLFKSIMPSSLYSAGYLLLALFVLMLKLFHIWSTEFHSGWVLASIIFYILTLSRDHNDRLVQWLIAVLGFEPKGLCLLAS